MNQSVFFSKNNSYNNLNKKKKCEDKWKFDCCRLLQYIGPTGPAGPQGIQGVPGKIGATGTSQIIGMAIVQTTAINSVLTVRNPSANATALTITPNSVGTQPVSAHFIVTQIQ